MDKSCFKIRSRCHIVRHFVFFFPLIFCSRREGGGVSTLTGGRTSTHFSSKRSYFKRQYSGKLCNIKIMKNAISDYNGRDLSSVEFI
jgi:hypothetical protein